MTRATRAISHAAPAAVLIALFWLLRAVPIPAVARGASFGELAMTAGFLFLVATLVGQLARTVGFPGITGYLLVGILLGPEALGLITEKNILDLALLDRLAIGVIAFVAGGELRPSMLRARGRAILWILLLQVGAVLVLVTAGLVAARGAAPFLAGRGLGAAVALALVFAAIAAIGSPAATLAVLDEEEADGPLAETVLGVVVAADVVVVLLVTLTLALARGVTGGGGIDFASLGAVAWELIGAIVAGGVLGLLIDGYLRWIGKQLPIFVIFLALLGFEVADALHVEFMLFMLSAGFFVENVSPTNGEPLVKALHTVGIPAYALFFALAGASIRLSELRTLWVLALVVVGTRTLALWLGCRTGARLARAEPVVERYAWLGLISQAGVAVGLVTVAARVLPDAGASMRTLFLATMALHQLAGPILLRLGVHRAGEAGGRARHASRPRAPSGGGAEWVSG